ncbi:hypothetical protein GJ744_008324 [Endocarpon pusillum]|uniref:HTH psq-type domain-containing protein n=1 Tax=Endocarpon pusillum TaxID=364733 RepID=A0A8H7E4I7_9EURO|nr:hypothetical protein GJ744_008324 [Endocarpon pusillum]
MSNKEKSIQKASSDVELGLFSSIRKAADYYDVPNSTVAHRRAGRPSVAEADRISQTQHLPPNYAQIRRMLVKLLQRKGDKIRLEINIRTLRVLWLLIRALLKAPSPNLNTFAAHRANSVNIRCL